MSFAKLTEKFDRNLEAISILPSNILEQATMAINLSSDFLHVLKFKILKDGFRDKNEEINFFKHIKQNPLIPLIYYSEIRSFELQFPRGDSHSQKKYIKKKIHKINRFFIYNIDFERYIDSKFTHFDTQFYTRDFLETCHVISSKFYFQDRDFMTSRDMLLGKMKAYAMFIIYLKNKLSRFNGNYSNDDFKPNFKWTESKSALTELVYALHQSKAINNGNVDLKDIAGMMEKTFNFDLTDFYKTFSEIKSRKKSRLRFLDELSTNLLSMIEKSEK